KSPKVETIRWECTLGSTLAPTH
ncbi:hypothetical protein FOXB_02661, partial [Fusarium oxysporum f. sp. conglutinans Fo5176]